MGIALSSEQGGARGEYNEKAPASAKDFFAVGNRRGAPEAPFPVLIEQTPPQIQARWFQNSGQWQLGYRIEDELGAIRRLRAALKNPKYFMLASNCEHFASYIATGKAESPASRSRRRRQHLRTRAAHGLRKQGGVGFSVPTPLVWCANLLKHTRKLEGTPPDA